MRLDLELLELDRKRYDKPKSSDYQRLLIEPTDVYVGGELVVSFQSPKFDTSPVLAAMRSLRYSKNKRTQGLVINSRTFGCMPRSVFHGHCCHHASLAKDHPAEDKVLRQFAVPMGWALRNVAPEVHSKQVEMVQSNVHPDWQLTTQAFSSGICNKDSELAYHHDAGNWSGSWSAMLVFTHDVSGGELSIPEIGVGLDFAAVNPALVLFDGHRFLHGVTPVKKRSLQGYRYSVVYYSLRDLKLCQPFREELRWAQELRTKLELARKDGNADPRKK